MKASRAWPVLFPALVAQACNFSNVPFFPPYAVEINVTDPAATSRDNQISGTFTHGSNELINTVGSCAVQIKLGQCKNAEEVWLTFKARENDPTVPRRCTPSVWERFKQAQGHSLALAVDPEFTRGTDSVYMVVMAGNMVDTDGNGLIDQHTEENRLSAGPFTVGHLDIYKATDNSGGSTSWPPFGEFYGDIEASEPVLGYVRGHIDAAVEATDGAPVGPRCHWSVEQLRQDN